MFHKTKRITNRKLLDQYHDLKCLACNKNKCDPAHIKTRGSGGHDTPDNILPLCRMCHIRSGSLGWYRFCQRYPHIELKLNELGWKFEFIFNKWKLIKQQ